MIEIYDEEGYIKEVIEHGLSMERWMRDLTLLVRYWKGEGKEIYGSKKKVKDRAREKCQKYVRGWNDNIHYKNFNKVFEAAWKNNAPLRKIKSIEFSREVLDWFLNLENYEITDEEVKKIQVERPKVVVKNKVMNERRIRFLFTLFVWSKIQESYLEKYNMHYLKGYEKRFKECADLNSAFNLKNERNLLFDLGFIYVNHSLGIDAIFMDNEVFKIPITNENRIILSGDDLYKCGYWLEKQKYGFYVCQNCGKEVLKKSKPKGGKPNKYCPECAKIIENDVKKVYFCEKCGKEIEHDSVTLRIRHLCAKCQAEKRAEKDRLRKSPHLYEFPQISPETLNPQTPDT